MAHRYFRSGAIWNGPTEKQLAKWAGSPRRAAVFLINSFSSSRCGGARNVGEIPDKCRLSAFENRPCLLTLTALSLDAVHCTQVHQGNKKPAPMSWNPGDIASGIFVIFFQARVILCKLYLVFQLIEISHLQ